MRGWQLAAFVAVTVAASQAAAGDFDTGLARFTHGDYDAARKSFGRVGGGDKAAAQYQLARIDIRQGRLAEAETRLRKLMAGRDAELARSARVLLAETLRRRGRYAEAVRELEPQHKANPNHYATRHALGLAYRDVGKIRESEAIFETFYDDYNAGKIDGSQADELFYVAEAARYLGRFQDASDQYGSSLNIDSKEHRVNIEWGRLFLSKFAEVDAQESFDEVLKVDPHHPDAHAGMADAKLETAYDVAGAVYHLKEALKTNPRHVPSLLLKASLSIDGNRWDQAKKTLNKVFEVNPDHFRGRALLATVFWLTDDLAGYEREKKRVLSINPAFAEFFHIVARSAVREHRYREAIELEKEAVGVDPEYYLAMQAIGTGYLRLGEEKEGIEWLEKAWSGDQYNLRTKNTLDLFDIYIPREYVFDTSKSFKFRFPKEEREILSRYLPPMLETAFADMVERYGFTPQKPVIIELFHDQSQYSVRTVGLPNLGALGICFGQVITTMSPSVGDLNWAMILWHELSHVFAIQLSNSRVPRWYTEGLSEYETIRARPEWRRENDAELWAAMKDDNLPSVVELNDGFMKPSMQEVVVAYHLSAVTMEYIANKYGFDKIVHGLKLFGQGKETPEVIETITGKTIPAFDAEFREYLTARLRPYRGTLHIPTVGYDEVEPLLARAKANKDSAKAQADLALAYFYDGKAEKADAAAKRSLALDATNRIALYVAAEIAVRSRDIDAAKAAYEKLLELGADSFDVRARLSLIAQRSGDDKAAVEHLCAAKSLDPERGYPYQMLAELYFAKGKSDEALRELESYVMIEQMQFGPLAKLVEEYSKKSKWRKVVRFGELALNIDPSHAQLQLRLGRAYLEVGRPKDALFSYETALLTQPRIRRPALAEIGRARALRALGKLEDARAAVDSALDTEPDNKDALDLKAELGKR